MKVDVIKLGFLEENCYFLTKENKTLIIDPGEDIDKILKFISYNNFNVIGILITHFHFDHIGALKELKEKYNVKVVSIKNKEVIKPFEYEIIETKGHTDDSVSYYFKKEGIIFTGDFLFKESIGRYDFDNSSEIDMYESLKKIKKLKEDLKIYPGHGEETTLFYELKYNEYLRDL